MRTASIGFDTNILVHAFDNTDAIKHAACQRLVQQIFDGERHGVLTTQVLAEFSSVVTRKQAMPRPTVAKILRVLRDNPNWTVHQYTAEDVESALSCDAPFWDALIASTLLRNGVRTILTYNGKDFADSGLKVQTP